MGESVLSPAAPTESPLYADAGLERRGGSLFLGGVALTAIADSVGTPAYLYNAGVIRRQNIEFGRQGKFIAFVHSNSLTHVPKRTGNS